jgi:hypothetical protein
MLSSHCPASKLKLCLVMEEDVELWGRDLMCHDVTGTDLEKHSKHVVRKYLITEACIIVRVLKCIIRLWWV